MKGSALPRTQLFADEPIGELRGLATLSDPDTVTAVVDLAVIGARGDGKTQFIVHAIRAMHAHAPALDGAEQVLNRDVLRMVLDPRRHGRTRRRLAWFLTSRSACARRTVRSAELARGAAAGVARDRRGDGADAGGGPGGGRCARRDQARGRAGVILAATGLVVGAVAALVARRRVARMGDVEVAFWDVAGEQVYSAAAADYYSLLGHLVEARRRRAHALGRAYAFAPVLICNRSRWDRGRGQSVRANAAAVALFAALDPPRLGR